MSGGVVVTGASSGIGRACALDLDRRGFRVFAGVRKEEDADALRRETTSGRITPVIVEVTDSDAIARLAQTVDQELGDEPLRGLVNNAGIGSGGPLETLDLDRLRQVFEVNTIAPVAVAQALLPRLRAARGRVVNVSSIGGRFAMPFLGPYSASKYGLEALSDALRRELRPWGIHVALIEPGNVKTRIWEKGASMLEEIRVGSSEEEWRMYGRNVERMDKLVRFADRTGVPPERVARVVAHALTSERPRVRYLVGPDARVQLAMARLLPARVVDRLLGKVTGG